jgi:hypothetical protein
LILASDDADPDSNTVIHVVKIFRMCETLSAKAILSFCVIFFLQRSRTMMPAAIYSAVFEDEAESMA